MLTTHLTQYQLLNPWKLKNVTVKDELYGLNLKYLIIVSFHNKTGVIIPMNTVLTGVIDSYLSYDFFDRKCPCKLCYAKYWDIQMFITYYNS